MERPADLLVAVGRDACGEDSVVDEGGECQGALVGGDGAGEFGVPQAQAPVDRADGADRIEGQMSDGQPAGAPAAAELGPVVLYFAVLDGEADAVGPRLLVDHAAQPAVTEERPLVPQRGHPAPHQVLPAQEVGPGAVRGHAVAELPTAAGGNGVEILADGVRDLRGRRLGDSWQRGGCRAAQHRTEHNSSRGHSRVPPSCDIVHRVQYVMLRKRASARPLPWW